MAGRAMPADRAQIMMLRSVSLHEDAQSFAQKIGASFAHFGFAIVSDHGIDQALLADAYDKARALFALPDDAKRAYHAQGSGGARGYTPFGAESAKGEKAADLKEFWHIGRDLPVDHAFTRYMPPNIWPDEIAGFAATYQQIFAQFDAVGGKILSAIARYLGLAPDFFASSVRDGNSVLRLLHYPPVAAGSGGVRAAAHGDINAVTLLLGAEESGLELLGRNGAWLPVQPGPGELAVNIGDMLERLTNRRLPSTVHRVVNPDAGRCGHSRYSMPFFLHFRPDFLLETLAECVDDAHPNLYSNPITADDFLQERLRDLGLK